MIKSNIALEDLEPEVINENVLYPEVNKNKSVKNKNETNKFSENSENSINNNKNKKESQKKEENNYLNNNNYYNINGKDTKLTINANPPYLPSKALIKNPKEYTLVLDLDETLVHFVEENDSAYIQIRPGAEDFLEEMSRYYEIVVFTAAMQDVFLINFKNFIFF